MFLAKGSHRQDRFPETSYEKHFVTLKLCGRTARLTGTKREEMVVRSYEFPFRVEEPFRPEDFGILPKGLVPQNRVQIGQYDAALL